MVPSLKLPARAFGSRSVHSTGSSVDRRLSSNHRPQRTPHSFDRNPQTFAVFVPLRCLPPSHSHPALLERASECKNALVLSSSSQHSLPRTTSATKQSSTRAIELYRRCATALPTRFSPASSSNDIEPGMTTSRNTSCSSHLFLSATPPALLHH